MARAHRPAPGCGHGPLLRRLRCAGAGGRRRRRLRRRRRGLRRGLPRTAMRGRRAGPPHSRGRPAGCERVGTELAGARTRARPDHHPQRGHGRLRPRLRRRQRPRARGHRLAGEPPRGRDPLEPPVVHAAVRLDPPLPGQGDPRSGRRGPVDQLLLHRSGPEQRRIPAPRPTRGERPGGADGHCLPEDPPRARAGLRPLPLPVLDWDEAPGLGLFRTETGGESHYGTDQIVYCLPKAFLETEPGFDFYWYMPEPRDGR